MRVLRSGLGLLAAVGLAGLPAAAGAQPLGSEFQVNTYTTSHQRTGNDHLVASDASGNFVLVWQSRGQDGGRDGIFGQRYDSGGGTLGDEFLVNSFTTGFQASPSVASDASGNFVVAWGSFGEDGSGYGIFAQRYDSGGAALGSEFRVNASTTNQQNRPSLSVAPGGDFVVVWESYAQDGSGYGIFGQRYDGAGGALGDEFRVNSFTPNWQVHASVASSGSGNFVVVWGSINPDGNGVDVMGQRYDGSGEALGDEFRVNSFTTSHQRTPSVASDSSGNFVVVWESYPQDGSDSGIFGQRYDSAGVAQGGEFQVNSFTTGYQSSPSVASDAAGNFVVVWQSYQDGSYEGIFGRRYDGGGLALGEEFQINTFTFGYQGSPSVGATGTNEFVVAWEAYGQDGSGYGVFGQRFTGLPSLSISDVSLKEGNLPGRASRNVALFAVSLSAPSTQSVTIDFTTANGTAMAPSDYGATSGTLTLSPGQTSRVTPVIVNEDNLHENNERFFVNLSNPVNATIADGQGVATILNDDP